jgi:hypothetical protein
MPEGAQSSPSTLSRPSSPEESPRGSGQEGQYKRGAVLRLRDVCRNPTLGEIASSDKVGAIDATDDDEDEEMGPASEERATSRDERGRRSPTSVLDQMRAAGLSVDEMNRLKVLVDGDRLQITGLNVDLDGIATLRKMLEKYEDIIKLQKGEKK